MSLARVMGTVAPPEPRPQREPLPALVPAQRMHSLARQLKLSAWASVHFKH